MKKKIFLFVIFIFGIITLGCDKDENDVTYVDTVIDISYVNSNRQDLLDADTPNSYNSDDIKIYHYINNEKILFSRGNLTYPSGFFIYKEMDMEYYMLRITEPNGTNEDGINSDYEAITLIELNTNETDTIKCVFRKGDNFFLCRSVHYNSNPVWTWEDNVPRKFTIQK
jgi:hypothetical protein